MKVERKGKSSLDFLFVTGPFGLHLTGGDRVVLNLAHELSQRGKNVGILFVSIRKYLSEYRTHKKLALLFYNSMEFRLLTRYSWANEMDNMIFKDKNLKFHFNSKKLMKNSEIKRAIAVGWIPALFVNTKLRSEFKYYFTQHDEDEPSYSGPYYKLAHLSYSFDMKKIVYNMHLLKRFESEDPIVLKLGLFWKPVFKIPIEQRPDGNVLLVLREHADKGAEDALKAAEIIHQNSNCTIKSFGNYKGNVPAFVNHKGWVEKEFLTELYNWASIFVLPSIIEGLSLTAAEAMNSGCAVVSTDNMGIRELIDDEKTGFLAPVHDSIGIAEKVTELINHRNKRIQIAEAGKKKVSSLTFEDTVEQFLESLRTYEVNQNGHGKSQ